MGKGVSCDTNQKQEQLFEYPKQISEQRELLKINKDCHFLGSKVPIPQWDVIILNTRSKNRELQGKKDNNYSPKFQHLSRST